MKTYKINKIDGVAFNWVFDNEQLRDDIRRTIKAHWRSGNSYEIAEFEMDYPSGIITHMVIC